MMTCQVWYLIVSIHDPRPLTYFYTISKMNGILMCSLSGCVYTYIRSWHSNANRSVDELCNVARDQIINYLFVKITVKGQRKMSLTIFVILTNCEFPSTGKRADQGKLSNGPISASGIVSNCNQSRFWNIIEIV